MTQRLEKAPLEIAIEAEECLASQRADSLTYWKASAWIGGTWMGEDFVGGTSAEAIEAAERAVDELLRKGAG